MINRPVSFALHIRVLFTQSQLECMSEMMDLSKLEDVKENASGIYRRLANHSMPADETGPWPNEWIDLFKRWMDEGYAS